MPSKDTSDRPVLTLIAGAPCSGRNRWRRAQADRLPATVYGTEAVRNEHAVSEQGPANWTRSSIVTHALGSTDAGIRAWAYRTLTGGMEEHLRAGRSFGLRTTLANDPLAERAVTAARAAGYRVHCHFIGAGSAQLTAGRARTSRTDLANDAAALWHMARERLAATADQYDVIELVRSQNDEQVTTHRFESRTQMFAAEAGQRRGADDALAAAITGSKTDRRNNGKSDRKPATATAEPGTPPESSTKDATPSVYRAMLHEKPAPPPELHALLRYLADAFTAVDRWLLENDRNEHALRLDERVHLKAAGIVDDEGPAETKVPTVTITHLPPDESPPATDTYRADQAEELLQDIASWAIERVEGRSGWRTWTSETRRTEEIRITLRGRSLEGWYVHVPLDSDGMPYGVATSLRCSDAEPDANSNLEVPLNLDATVMLEQLCRCVRKPG